MMKKSGLRTGEACLRATYSITSFRLTTSCWPQVFHKEIPVTIRTNVFKWIKLLKHCILFKNRTDRKTKNIDSKMPEYSNKLQCRNFLLKEWGCFGTRQNMEDDQKSLCKLARMASLTWHRIIKAISAFVAQHEFWNARGTCFPKISPLVLD